MDKKVAKTKKGTKKIAVVGELSEKDKQLVIRINALHGKFEGIYQNTLDIAAQIGELLCQKKSELAHGLWGKWIKANLKFTSRTATNYISIYKNKEKLELQNCKGVFKALNTLKDVGNPDRTDTRQETKEYRRAFADQNVKYDNPKGYINSVICGNNVDVLKKMIDEGMGGKYSAVICSPPYNSGFYYGKNFNDDKPYEEYLEGLLKVFPLYAKLCRPGSRIIYVVGNVVKNQDRDKGGDYYHPLASDLIQGVRDLRLNIDLFNEITWDKSSRKDPLNKQYGTYCSPKRPLSRSCTEKIIVWSYKGNDLEDIEGYGSDITPEEFEFCSWNKWNIPPFSHKYNPHPCSFAPRIVELLLKFYSYKNDLILDPYAGISTTAQVCKKLHRRFTMVELNGNFCNESVRLLKTA